MEILLFGIIIFLIVVLFLLKNNNSSFEENKNLKLELDEKKVQISVLNMKNEENIRLISKYESIISNQEESTRKHIEVLESAKKLFEEEKEKNQKEKLNLLEEQLEEKNKVWIHHENSVIYKIKELCKKPDLDFEFFDNKNTPKEFSNNLKPDCMVKFIDQYIVFDAKFSNQKNPQTYFKDQIKKTAEKYKNLKNIYSSCFFIIPNNRLEEVKENYFFEDRFNFFIVPYFALETLLFLIKKTVNYAKFSKITTEDRENIINLIANFDSHINFQNTVNKVFIDKSKNLENFKNRLKTDLKREIRTKIENLPLQTIKPSELIKNRN